MKKILLLVSVIVLSLTACQPDKPDKVTEQPIQEENVVILDVNSFWQPCVGVSPRLCLQVKEAGQENWTFFYDQIEGFTYEPGYLYQLKVSKQTVADAPADASSIKWTLVEEVSKNAVENSHNDLADTSWTLTSNQGSQANSDNPITLEFNSETDQFGGNAGCNQYFASYELKGSEFTVTTQIGSTRKMCEESVMQQETSYLQKLEKMQYFQVSENDLLLVSMDGLFLEFEK
jgi:heat shock protein HslJ